MTIEKYYRFNKFSFWSRIVGIPTHIRKYFCVCTFIFRFNISPANSRCTRNRYVASIIARFFARFISVHIREQEEVARFVARASVVRAPDLQRPLLQEIACGTTHLQRANVTLPVCASRASSVLGPDSFRRELAERR